MSEVSLTPAERIILAIDVSTEADAERLVGVAKEAGARFVKLGLELSTATSWTYCSDLASGYGLDWVADAKLDDIPNTVAGAARNISNKAHKPFGITIHANSGLDSMRSAQEIAEEEGVLMFGVTHLTSIDDKETKDTYRFLRTTLVKRRAAKAKEAGIGGVVCSVRELKALEKSERTSGLFSMIPGTRSINAGANDQKNVRTPREAASLGAGLIVVGRQVTESSSPSEAFQKVVDEISFVDSNIVEEAA